MSRYSFYDKKHWCTEDHTFRFGGSCRRCSTGPCPDGQYRVACSGGSDSYCTACNNICTKFNQDKSATESSTPPIAVCLEDALPSSLTNMTLTNMSDTCDPNKDRSRCAYTSDGAAATSTIAASDCQIELCCNTCSSDEDAVKKGFGTVCVGSSAGLTKPDELSEVRFVAETPGSKEDFNARGDAYKHAFASAAGVAESRVNFLWVADVGATRRDREGNATAAQRQRLSGECSGSANASAASSHYQQEFGKGAQVVEWNAETNKFGVAIETAAQDIDLLWAKLSEGARVSPGL